jgi:hypothetical protein
VGYYRPLTLTDLPDVVDEDKWYARLMLWAGCLN